jgi:hypothetical protein
LQKSGHLRVQHGFTLAAQHRLAAVFGGNANERDYKQCAGAAGCASSGNAGPTGNTHATGQTGPTGA